MACGGMATRAPPELAIEPLSKVFLARVLVSKMRADAVMTRFLILPTGLRRFQFLYRMKCSEESFFVPRAVSRQLVQRLATDGPT
jgi:hypothetical protein